MHNVWSATKKSQILRDVLDSESVMQQWDSVTDNMNSTVFVFYRRFQSSGLLFVAIYLQRGG